MHSAASSKAGDLRDQGSRNDFVIATSCFHLPEESWVSIGPYAIVLSIEEGPGVAYG